MTTGQLPKSPGQSLELISKASYLPDAKTSWDAGSNIIACLRENPQATKAAICALILDVISFVDAKKTLQKAEDIAFTSEAILEGFPTLKLEELKLVCKRMKLGYYGNYYERLKTPEFMEALKRHEEERAEYLEVKHKTQLAQVEVETAQLNSQVYSFRELADKLSLPRKGAKTLRDFMAAGPVLTSDEMKAIDHAQEAHEDRTEEKP